MTSCSGLKRLPWTATVSSPGAANAPLDACEVPGFRGGGAWITTGTLT